MLKHSRSKSITVDGQRLRYVITDAAVAGRRCVALAITVQHEQVNGARLHITGLSTQRVPEADSKFQMGRTVERPIGPRHVERLIRLAITEGWRPTSPGKAFELRTTNAVL